MKVHHVSHTFVTLWYGYHQHLVEHGAKSAAYNQIVKEKQRIQVAIITILIK